MRMRDEKGIDDKIVAVSVRDPAFADYTDKAQLPPHMLRELRRFFEDYKVARAQAGRRRGSARRPGRGQDHSRSAGAVPAAPARANSRRSDLVARRPRRRVGWLVGRGPRPLSHGRNRALTPAV